MADGRPLLIDALHAEAFEEMLPRLVAYAARRLRRVGWGAGKDERASAAEAEEIVSGAVEACLSGAWVWPEDLDLETFLRGVMWSRVAHERRRASVRRTRPIHDAEDFSANAPATDELIEQRRLLAAVRVALAGDAEIEATIAAIEEGHTKRADLAAALGWSVERVKAVRVRMNRRLAAAKLTETNPA